MLIWTPTRSIAITMCGSDAIKAMLKHAGHMYSHLSTASPKGAKCIVRTQTHTYTVSTLGLGHSSWNFLQLVFYNIWLMQCTVWGYTFIKCCLNMISIEVKVWFRINVTWTITAHTHSFDTIKLNSIKFNSFLFL